MSPFFLFFLFIFTLSTPPPSSAQRNLTSFSISDSPWTPLDKLTLLSPNSAFAAGFLPLLPSSSSLYNFSIWFSNISAPNTVVWSTTGPPLGPDATLSITSAGLLRLSNSSSGENLFPGTPSTAKNTTQLKLRNDGNLIYGDWQSFSFPTDTALPNQSLSGNFTLVSKNRKFSFINSTQLVFNFTEQYQDLTDAFLSFDSSGQMKQANGKSFIVSDFGLNNSRRLTLDNDGNLRIYSFDPTISTWKIVWQSGYELCQVHGACGPNAICVSDGSSSSYYCVCPPGFQPVPNGAIEDQGCERKIPLAKKTKFLQLDYVNFTGGSNQTNWPATNFSQCQSRCLNRDNCLGFMFKYDGQGFCVLQLDRLLYGYWSPGTERAMFLRVDGAETDKSNFTGMTELLETTCPVEISLPLPPQESNATTRNIVIICTLFAAELISGVLFFWAFIKKYIKYRDMARTLGLEFLPAGGPKRFSYAELKAATKDFSNLIGRGGFGDVYRGELTDQRVVAVKCLKHVAGGDAEFWAEVTIIARMHHLNLVRLWGFCAEKGQRILVYEYVPNGSLDNYLFKPGRVLATDQESDNGAPVEDEKPILDWGIRYRIALGVARSIAYLHEECLEWVLHCDIKPENILLGDDFCPKISDFGLAKLKKKEDMVTISRMQGTRGYMAPEWVKMDPITPKADVYSFGMVLLELVTGVRNNDVQGSMMESEDWYFPRWAFEKVFKEMNVEDILDRHIKHCYDSRTNFDAVNRMVKTAMWCLQDRPEMRPSMGKVAKMLEGTVDITEPKKPTIFFLSDD
ncbi:G-type lectin S-receptor-like serine/threonine-protein kinase At5g24080 [Argentina anserina]|uniref:G-type lectin S-receptor-like serine/threonine-protein kinase At5g24080 n=1 Tax=Argentina anserina TaxID=57926 RepID=UPI0021766D1F|nr:G-type lectin S-receptor-like serine/threonine-protein kinase At5g24080 [Potentilla anserina]